MDVLDISDFFSNFYISYFSIFAYGYSQIRKLGCLKSKISKHPSFGYSPTVKYENLDFKKSEISKHPSFRYLPVVKYEKLTWISVSPRVSSKIYDVFGTCHVLGVNFAQYPAF